MLHICKLPQTGTVIQKYRWCITTFPFHTMSYHILFGLQGNDSVQLFLVQTSPLHRLCSGQIVENYHDEPQQHTMHTISSHYHHVNFTKDLQIRMYTRKFNEEQEWLRQTWNCCQPQLNLTIIVECKKLGHFVRSMIPSQNFPSSYTPNDIYFLIQCHCIIALR